MNEELRKIIGIARFLEEKKCNNVILYDSSESNSFYEYIIVATALNSRHLSSLKDEVLAFLEKKSISFHHAEGKNSLSWILIDCYNLVINIFIDSERERLNFDELFIKTKNPK